jgi:dihydrofolate synthase/folylpolyglutamate synthase
LRRYNERVRIAGREADDTALMAALETVERARTGIDAAPTPLTYFEFGTLAALVLFAQARLGCPRASKSAWAGRPRCRQPDRRRRLGGHRGRSSITWTILGATREAIGAGEGRASCARGIPAVCGDRDPPASLDRACAGDRSVRCIASAASSTYVRRAHAMALSRPCGERFGLPVPALRGRYQLANAATALTVLDLIREQVPIDAGAVRAGLAGVELAGRFQVLPGRPTIVLDVAHNPQAAGALAATLGEMGYHPQTRAVVGMLSDKDIDGVVAHLAPRVDRWYVATLPGPRGASAQVLADHLRARGVAQDAVAAFLDVPAALAAARDASDDTDRIVVFGSFLTVAAALAALAR